MVAPPTGAVNPGGANQNGGGLTGSLGQDAATAASVFGIAQGLRRGGVSGYGGAAVNAAQLANRGGYFSGGSGPNTQAGGALGVAGGALGIYNGIKQGGVLGYGGAAVGGLQMAAGAESLMGNAALAGTLGAAAGYVAAPLAVYGAIKNWQSGATGQDALQGAEAGAAIGSVVPGLGTAAGFVIGGAVGAVSSLFGNGKVDPENTNFNQYTQAFNKAPANMKGAVAASMTNPYTALAGYFDLRSNQMKGSNPIYSTFGRMGEQKFTNALIQKVQTAQKSGGVQNASQMMNQVVQPWLNSMGNWQDANKDAMTALIQNMTGQIMTGSYKTNFKAVGGDTPFG